MDGGVIHEIIGDAPLTSPSSTMTPKAPSRRMPSAFTMLRCEVETYEPEP